MLYNYLDIVYTNWSPSATSKYKLSCPDKQHAHQERATKIATFR